MAHLKATVKLFAGTPLGFTHHDVSARSLRAAGAMALLCLGVDHDIISLIGRWRSDEMTRYLPWLIMSLEKFLMIGSACTCRYLIILSLLQRPFRLMI